jgi:hypothetical protein
MTNRKTEYWVIPPEADGESHMKLEWLVRTVDYAEVLPQLSTNLIC